MFKYSVSVALLAGLVSVASASDVTISPADRHQVMVGFGGAISWYATWIYKGDAANDAAVNQLMFEDSGLDVVRFKNWYFPDDSGATASQAAIDNAYFAAKAANPNIQVLLSSWSPPARLKSNGERKNGGTLTNSVTGFAYSEFAQYWVDWLDNVSWDPDYLSFQNEPGWVATWESCEFAATEGSKAGYGEAADAIWNAISNRTDCPKMLGSDAENMPAFFTLNATLTNRDYFAVNGYHTYDVGGTSKIDSQSTMNKYHQIRDDYGERPNWVTEYSNDGFDWINAARMIHNAVVEANASAYIYWKLSWSTNCNDTMIGFKNSSSGEYEVRNHYYTLKHYAKYVDMGDQRITVTSANSNVKVSGFLRVGATNITLVAINKSTSAQQIDLVHSLSISSVEGYQSSGTNMWSTMSGLTTNNIGLPGKSMTTLLLTLSEPYNSPPQAYDDAVSLPANTNLLITLPAYDDDGDTLSYSIVTNPVNGVLSGSGSNRTYSANTNFNGFDSFAFRVNDGKLDSNIGTISILVGSLPATVTNRGYSSLMATEATISGELLTGFSADAWFCWGDNDGGMISTGTWDNVISIGTVAQSNMFSTNITGLATNTTYWYRCYVTNAAGMDWSDSATSFSGIPVSTVPGGGSFEPIGGAYFEWDAAKDLGGDSQWTSVTANAYAFTFTANQTPVAAGDSRFDAIESVYNLSTARADGSTFNNKGDKQDATFEFVLDTDSTNGVIFETGGNGTGLQFDIHNGELRFHIRLNATPITVAKALTETDMGRLIHVVGVADLVNNELLLYLDGKLVSSNLSFTATDWCGTDGSGLGKVQGTSASSGAVSGDEMSDFQGKIAFFRYYSGKAFTAAEVTTNFMALSTGTPAANLAPTGITSNNATLNAAISANTTGFDVHVFWGITDGGTNAGSWSWSDYVGSWTNAVLEVSYQPGSLSYGQTYYYTFMASNTTTVGWAAPSWQFITAGVYPAVTVNHSIPHAWLHAMNPSWTNDFEYAATNDADGDGFSTAEEYWAGTDPTNGESYLKLEKILQASTNVQLVWSHAQVNTGIPDISIQTRPSLVTGEWVYAGQKSPTNGTNTWETSFLDNGYFRLCVTNMP